MDPTLWINTVSGGQTASLLLVIRIISNTVAVDIARRLDLKALLPKNSFFLLGPRATGKSHLIRRAFGDRAVVLDLLRADMFLRLSTSPHELEAMVDALVDATRGTRVAEPQIVVIDEVQKLPELLDEVHRLIETRRWHFLLTGSSARKLKRGRVNLLAGRAWQAELFPLTWAELGPRFQLGRALRYGTLPRVYLGRDPEEELHSYVHTYLEEEIRAEGLVRGLAAFSRFLRVAALSSGQLINFANVASDAQMSASTVREHFQLLEDTLVGFALAPWTRSKKRKAITTAKFYLFDTGVTHTAAGTESLDRNSDGYGRAFEQWLACEIRAAMSYQRTRADVAFWRSTHGHEVDFVLADCVAIEVKASKRVTERDTKGLRALAEEGMMRSYFLVSDDRTETKSGGIRAVHYQTFLELLWSGKLLSG